MRKIVNKVILVLLFLSLCVSTAFLAYLHFFAPDDKDLSGEWIAELDITAQAAVTAIDWLQDIEGVSISLEDLESYMQNLTIQVNLNLEQTARSEGTFQCNILPESYDSCRQAAYEGFAAAFRNLLAERLRMAGYTGDTDEEAMESLVTETFGMSTVSYLMSCGPVLLPSLEELQSRYDGSGTYKAAENILIREFATGGAAAVKEESYIRQDSSLILSADIGSDTDSFLTNDYPVIYTLKQNEGSAD